MAKRNLPLGGAIPMEPGERDRKVTIQAVTSSVGASGRPIETVTTLASVWMRRLDLSMTEAWKTSQLSAAATTQWEMGYREDMDPELVDVPRTRRLLYQGRAYDITGASQIGRREGIELLTLAKVG